VTEIGIIAPIGGILLACVLYVRIVDEDPPMRRWALAFGCLYAAGLLTALRPVDMLALALANLLHGAFVGLVLQGALTFAARPVPRWVVPLPLGLGVVRAALTLSGYTTPGFLVPLPLDCFYFGWTAWILWRKSDEAGRRPAGRLLGVCAAEGVRGPDVETARWQGAEAPL
jgi:hypothetical protein